METTNAAAVNTTRDHYLAHDGRTERAFPFTADGLRAAWAFALTLRFGTVCNPNRCGDDSDGMSADERDVRDEIKAGA